ncbi:nucleotidyltransferase domain-containing protein [Candidatus Woesearchaeota archaeon]|nr:nucleotidyltransferase domain-containing protein [Candidatus Woesearchaeota archaeon]
MLTKQQLTILGVFKKDLFASLTFKQIKEESKQKSNNIVQIAIKKFKEQDLVRTEVTGDVTTYSLNLDNNLTLSYLNIINDLEIHKKRFPKEILSEIQKRLSKQTNFFILIVFGSYAKNKATEKSDLDIAVIVESEQIKKEITPFLETVKRREIKPLDYHVFTKSEFLEMLKAESENVGKQIYKNNLIYYGFIEYCNLIRGRKNG